MSACLGDAKEAFPSHLSTTVDGLSKPDMFLVLCASVPVLAGDALRVGIDAGLAGGEVAEDLDGIIYAALVGVDPVKSCTSGEKLNLDLFYCLKKSFTIN